MAPAYASLAHSQPAVLDPVGSYRDGVRSKCLWLAVALYTPAQRSHAFGRSHLVLLGPAWSRLVPLGAPAGAPACARAGAHAPVGAPAGAASTECPPPAWPVSLGVFGASVGAPALSQQVDIMTSRRRLGNKLAHTWTTLVDSTTSPPLHPNKLVDKLDDSGSTQVDTTTPPSNVVDRWVDGWTTLVDTICPLAARPPRCGLFRRVLVAIGAADFVRRYGWR